jgi:hypothetical protein
MSMISIAPDSVDADLWAALSDFGWWGKPWLSRRIP